MECLSSVHVSNSNVSRRLKLVSISCIRLDVPDICSADIGCACKSKTHLLGKILTFYLPVLPHPPHAVCYFSTLPNDF